MREINCKIFCDMIYSAAANLSNHRSEVDNMNVFPVPDGDTGTNMSMTIDACENAVAQSDQKDISSVAKTVADAALRGARGNSGVILSQLLRGIQKSVSGKSVLNCLDISRAVQHAARSAYKAVMKPTEGTILTVARKMSECAKQYESDFDDVADFAAVIVKAGNDALAQTPNMLRQLKEAGVVDSGGQGLMYIAEGALGVLVDGNIVQRMQKNVSTTKVPAAGVDIDNLKYQYCTECIVEKNDKNADAFSFKMKLEPIGDSMVVVDDDEVIKVHIHTNTPDFVLNEALKLGELYSVKIENMKLQHSNIIMNSEKATGKTAEVPKKNDEPKKKYGFVSVAVGDGIESTFTSLGVDRIIKGGQTMNPSTDDILSAVMSVNAENVYIFPNNKNIIMASQQAAELCEKSVFVIPTVSMMQAMTCMFEFDEDASPEDNCANMKDAIGNVKSAQLTYAVRDTVVDGKEIHPGDILGMVEGKITEVGKSINDTVIKTLSSAVDDDSSVITLFYGDEISENDADALKLMIESEFDDCEVFMHFGGQPVYYYLISVE